MSGSCRLLMTVPGVGPVTSLAFRTAVEDPARFARSQLVGAHFGLTPRKYASGETNRNGGITKCGDRMVRAPAVGGGECAADAGAAAGAG